MAQASRNTIFISHANPADNEFARWLAQRLTRCGYEVWVDLEEFLGGEYMWDDIERILRTQTRVFVSIASRNSQSALGTKKELELAINLERANPDCLKVVGIKMDDLPFCEINIHLNPKFTYDINDGWRSILERLRGIALKIGLEKRDDRTGAFWLSQIYNPTTSFKVDVQAEPDTLVSNWIRVVDLPSKINFLRFKGDQRSLKRIEHNQKIPCIRKDRLFLTFANVTDFLALPDYLDFFEQAYEYDREEFFEADKKIQGWTLNVRRCHLANLLNKAFRNELARRGLRKYETSDRQNPTWIFDEKNFEQQKIRIKFQDERRSPVSLYNRLKGGRLSWHLGLSAQSMTSDPLRFALKTHIVFTNADGEIVQSTERQHALRRGQCKSWNNRRWRNFVLAATTWLSNGEDQWPLYFSDSTSIIIEGSPMLFQSPSSFIDPEYRRALTEAA